MRTEIVFQSRTNFFVIFLTTYPSLVTEHLLTHLSFQSPRVNIILEVEILLEHLTDRCFIASHLVQQDMLFRNKLVLDQLFV